MLEVPFEIVSALLFSLLGCIAINLKRTVPMYFIVALNAFCIVSCGESIGIIFNTLFAALAYMATSNVAGRVFGWFVNSTCLHPHGLARPLCSPALQQ